MWRNIRECDGENSQSSATAIRSTRRMKCRESRIQSRDHWRFLPKTGKAHEFLSEVKSDAHRSDRSRYQLQIATKSQIATNRRTKDPARRIAQTHESYCARLTMWLGD